MLHQRRYALAVFTAATLLLTACAPQIVTVTVTTPPEMVTMVVTATPSPSPIPTPPPEPKVLTVCLVGEPDTLYLYGSTRLASARHVMELLSAKSAQHRRWGRVHAYHTRPRRRPGG